MTTSDLIAYYQGLLIMQYAALGNAMGTVQAVMTALIQNQIVQKVQDGFDLNTAIGAQLDILGTYRGVNRILYGIVPATNWSLIPYGDATPNSYSGWGLYADATPPTWTWISYNDLYSVATSLLDSQMRVLIQFSAAADSLAGGLGDYDNMLYSFFGTNVSLQDNGDMTMVYQHKLTDQDPNVLFTITSLAGALPHPAGVSFTIAEV